MAFCTSCSKIFIFEMVFCTSCSKIVISYMVFCTSCSKIIVFYLAFCTSCSKVLLFYIAFCTSCSKIIIFCMVFWSRNWPVWRSWNATWATPNNGTITKRRPPARPHISPPQRPFGECPVIQRSEFVTYDFMGFLHDFI